PWMKALRRACPRGSLLRTFSGTCGLIFSRRWPRLTWRGRPLLSVGLSLSWSRRSSGCGVWPLRPSG
ncbi:unnamed protein product, partial [Prorocentrum cordatum]